MSVKRSGPLSIQSISDTPTARIDQTAAGTADSLKVPTNVYARARAGPGQVPETPRTTPAGTRGAARLHVPGAGVRVPGVAAGTGSSPARRKASGSARI